MMSKPALRPTAGHALTAGDRTGGSVVDLGDLPAGRPLWVVGRVPRGEGGPLSFRLATGRDHELAGCRIEPAGEAPEGRALRALFGARRVLALEHLIHAGYAEAELGAELRRLGHDPDRVLEGRPEAAPKVYAENARAGALAALRECWCARRWAAAWPARRPPSWPCGPRP